MKFDPCFPTDVEFKLADVEASWCLACSRLDLLVLLPNNTKGMLLDPVKCPSVDPLAWPWM